MLKLTPTKLRTILEISFLTQERTQQGTPFVMGGTGLGKTVIPQQIARANGWRYISCHISQLGPEDIKGLPDVQHIDGQAISVWALPSFLPRDDQPTLLHFDELNIASARATRAAALQLFDSSRRVGDYVLPTSVRLLASGNPPEVQALGGALDSATASRFCHYELVPDVGEWSQWAVGADIHPAIIAYVNFAPEHLNYFQPQSQEGSADPRSWETLSNLLVTAEEREASDFVIQALSVGACGQHVGTSFSSYYEMYRHLPDVSRIISNPDTAQIYDRCDLQYAVMMALASLATRENYDSIGIYADRAELCHGREFSSVLNVSAGFRNPEICKTSYYGRWAIKNEDWRRQCEMGVAA